MSNPRLKSFAEAYLAMAGQARYRPQAPGDGFGNEAIDLAIHRWITEPDEQIPF